MRARNRSFSHTAIKRTYELQSVKEGVRSVKRTDQSSNNPGLKPGTFGGASRFHGHFRVQRPVWSRHQPISQILESIIWSTNVGRLLSVAFDLSERNDNHKATKHADMWEKEDQQKKNSGHATGVSECSEHSHLASKSDVQCGEQRVDLICWKSRPFGRS